MFGSIMKHLSCNKCKYEVFSVCQYNIQTLLCVDERKCFFNKAKMHGIAIVCLNETREKVNGIRSRFGFVCCMSAASDVNYGCQIAFNLSSVYYNCNGIDCKVNPRNVTIIVYVIASCAQHNCISMYMCM